MKTLTIKQLFGGSTKRVRILVTSIVACLALMTGVYYIAVVNPSFAKAFSGTGAGTSEDPYQISTCAQLQEMGSAPTASYIFVNDIDCTDTFNWNQGSGFIPIDFSGSLNGRNYTITGLFVQRPYEYAAGLFNRIQSGGYVRNFKLVNSEFTEGQTAILAKNNIGSLAGEVLPNATVKNVHSELNVKSDRGNEYGNVGGLVGLNRGIIVLSSASGSVQLSGIADPGGRYGNVGGLVGSMDNFELSNRYISDSYATGLVTVVSPDNTAGTCGGLIGTVEPGTSLQKSYSTGTVTCMIDNGTSTGGLIGRIGIDETETNIDDPTVDFNFTTSPVNPGVTSNSSGFAGYTPSTTVWLGTNYYDATATGKTTCVTNQPAGCNVRNSNGDDPDYFKNGSNNPLDTFDDINWTIDSALPVHKVFPASPDAPTGISVVRDGADLIVNWEAPVEADGRSVNIQDYQVFYKDDTNNGSWTSQQDNYGPNLSATITGLTLPGAYSFKIRARNNDIGGGVMNGLYATAQIAIGAPSSAPQNVQGQGRAKSVVLNWESVQDATTYKVQYRRIGSTDWTPAVTAQISGTSATIYSLVSQTGYQFRVQAFNNAGTGPWSDTVDATTITSASYTVTNCQQLQDMKNDLEANYTITNNIDCSTLPSTPVAGIFEPVGNGVAVFNGSLNGNNYKITGLTVDHSIQNDNTQFLGAGLFGVVAGATIQNIDIEGGVITGTYTLPESIDANNNGLPDATIPITNIPSGSDITGAAADSAVSLQTFSRFAVGGVAGVVAGWGTYSNLKVNDTVVSGPISGSVFGVVYPMGVISGTIIAPDSEDGNITLNNLSSSGAVYGLVSGGVIGAGLSSLTDFNAQPGQLIINNAQSTSSVDANIGGGILGVGISFSAMLPLAQQVNQTGSLGDAVDTALNTQAVLIQNSTATGTISTCTAPSDIRFGSLGGILGAGVGVSIKDSSASGDVTTCSNTSDSLGQIYGGTQGGLAGFMLVSRLENTHASGAVKAIYNSPEGSEVGGVNSMFGSIGGLVGMMLNAGDQNGKYAVENSYATGPVESTGSYGGIWASGGLIGVYSGSGTIHSSYSKGAVTSTLPTKNVISAIGSGGLVGIGVGADIPYIFGASFGTPVAPTYGLRIDNSYSEGAVIVNKVGPGQSYTTTGGLAGILIGQVSVTNAYATGDARLQNRDQQKIFVGDTQTTPTTDALAGADLGLNVSGGLVGSTWGVDGRRMLATLTGATNAPDIQPGILIDNTHASGKVNGIISGGLVGATELNTKINKSYAEGDVKGTVVGGLVGESGAVSLVSSALFGVAISGGQTGFSNMVPVVGNYIDSGFNAVGSAVDQQTDILSVVLGRLSDAVSPVEITNTYTTGAVNGVRPYLAVEGASVPSIDGLTTSFPTIAGGIVGLFASPGGKLTNSYGSGTVTIDPVPELPQRKTGVIQPPIVPSIAGGITGLTVAVPKVNFENIKNYGNPSSDVNSVIEEPAEIKNVFSASMLNINNDTLTGGSTGVFISPLSIGSKLMQWGVDDENIYQTDNIYFDQAKINVASCTGLTDIPETVYKAGSTGYYPGENDENTLDDVWTNPTRKDEAKGNIEQYASLADVQVSCTAVNKNNVQPDYFKNNKTNGPLPTWNFSSVWVVRKNDYPKFVAGVSTTTPNSPTTPGTNTTTPNSPTTPGTTPPTQGIPPTTGYLRKQIAKFARVNNQSEQVKGFRTLLANVPIFVARSIPYSLILLLLLVATLYSWQALRQYRELSVYHKRIMRILSTKESIDNYLAITTHYLNTPVAIMNGSVELLLSLKKISTSRADALTSKIKKFSTASEQLLVANQVSGAQAANDEKILKHDQQNPLKEKEVWIPAIIALGLISLANALFIYADVFNTSPFRIGIEVGLFILSVLLVALAYRYREYLESSKILAREQLKLESELYKKREAFIPEASKVTSEHLESLQITGKTLEKIPEAKLFFNGLAMLEGINTGLVNLKKFAQFNNDPPLFDITTYAKKSVDKFTPKAKQKNVKIETKVDTGLVSRIQPEEIRQLVDSLLDNAVKFSDKDTTVTLDIYRRFNKIVISVSDKGAGISEHKLPSLLKPFSRGTDSMQYNYEGVGLGLYADKIIVDKLGGTISITSKLGEGTTTTIAIPANYDAKANVPVLVLPDVTPA